MRDYHLISVAVISLFVVAVRRALASLVHRAVVAFVVLLILGRCGHEGIFFIVVNMDALWSFWM